MCGRIFLSYDIALLLRVAGTNLMKNSEGYTPSYNVAPQENLAVIRRIDSPQDNNRLVDIMKWGYQPFQSVLFNARAENRQKKKMFAPLIDTRRCVVIVEGYFQWNAQKEPFVFRPKKRDNKNSEEEKPIHFLIAALYAADGSVILMTRESIGEARNVHTRMPVLLDHDEVDAWLDCEKYKYENLQAQILDDQKDKWKSMFFYQIAPSVGDVKNKSEKVLIKAQEYDQTTNNSGIKRFFASSSKEKQVDNTKYHDYIIQDDGDDNDDDDIEVEEQEQSGKKSVKASPAKLEEKKELKHDTEIKVKKESPVLNEQEEVKKDELENEPGVKKQVINPKSHKKETQDETTTQESDNEIHKGKESKSHVKKEGENQSEMKKTLKKVEKALTEVGIDSGKVIKARNAIIIVEKSDEESKEKEHEVSDQKENEQKAGNSLKKRKDYEGKSETEYVPDAKKMKKGSPAPAPVRR